MRTLKAILRQGVDLILLGVIIGTFIAFLKGWHDAGYMLGICALYVAGSIYNKARLSMWIEDNNLKP